MPGGFIYEVKTGEKTYLVVTKVKNAAQALTTFHNVYGHSEVVEAVEFSGYADAIQE